MREKKQKVEHAPNVNSMDEVDLLKANVKELTKQSAAYKGRAESLQRKLNALQDDYAKAQRTITEKQARIESLEHRIKDISDTENGYVEALNEASAKANTYKAKIDYYERLPWYRRIFL